MATITKEKSQKINYALIKAVCKKCGWEWYPRKETRPIKCPNAQCQTYNWDTYTPKKEKD